MSRVALTPDPNDVEKIFNVKQEATEAFANRMDALDPLKRFRHEFEIPVAPNNNAGRQKAISLTGFGLGLQPKRTLYNLQEACREWGELGSRSYIEGKRPLISCELTANSLLLPIIGAKNQNEVAIMNSCSVNANLLMISFYRPTSTRYKILIEGGSFCSDFHVIQGQLNLHGFKQDGNKNKRNALIEVYPRHNEYCIRNEDIIAAIHEHNTSISMLWLGVTQHYTGQLFDVANIVKIAHKYGIYVGLDLSHGVGNVPLSLHDWNVDFAAFGCYKYLNGSGGAVGGIFVHQKHHKNEQNEQQFLKLQGWWGQDLKERYKFLQTFTPCIGAKSWSISQTCLFQCVALESALEIFDEAGFKNLRIKSIALTKFLELLITTYLHQYIDIMTPSDPQQRGCQLSLAVKENNYDVDHLCSYLRKKGVIVSTRKPNVMRASPTPLYNTFTEVWDFVTYLRQYYGSHKNNTSSKL